MAASAQDDAQGRPSLDSIAIELTGRCNQKCSYCYNAWREDEGAAIGELSLETITRFVDSLSEQVRLRYIVLTGGEPLMRRDIHEIIDRIDERGIGVAIISNGGLITKTVARRLKEQGVRNVQITLAGAEARAHDEVCGGGTFRRALRALDQLQAVGMPMSGSFLCTQQSFDQAGRTIELFAARGIKRISFNRFSPAGDGTEAALSLMPTRAQVLVALYQADARTATLGLDTVCTMPIPRCMCDRDEYPNVKFGACSAGGADAQFAIGPDGGVRLCTLQKNAVGSILETPFADIIQREAVAGFRRQIPEPCKACPYATTCLGGCGAAAEWIFGTAGQLDPFVAQHVMADFVARVSSRQPATD